jgi:hypothetical protein
MNSYLEKSPDISRAFLLGLLANCIFSTGAQEDCPLWELRNSFSIEQKYEYVMGLNNTEVKDILLQHECCYEKRLSSLDQW